MTSIRLRFPASRYHATPWGRHVNEGVPEWPPSPYRLLRALYDTWKRKCSHLSEPEIADLLGALAREEPRFVLPRAVASHTRSYLSSNSEDPTEKSLIFDAFVAFDKTSCCYLNWPTVHLTDEQQRTLSDLLRNLNYLGRSESWIEAELYSGVPDGPHRCEPAHATEISGEAVPVACALSPADYDGKRPWLDALTVSTTELLKSRRSAPPLLKTVRYVRPENAIEIDPAPATARVDQSVNAVLLGLDCTVLPLVTATIEVAEQIRVRLMGAHKMIKGDPADVSPVFSGKDNGHKRLDHGHVFILPLANEKARIDRVLLLSKAPFTRDELGAIRCVRRLWRSDGPVRCVIVWHGAADSDTIRRRASTVVSTTPFVTARHWRRGRDLGQFLEDEIRRECRNHGMLEPRVVEPMSRPYGGNFECVEFRRNRREEPPRAGYAFRLVFGSPQLVPFSLGYGCHFGLGQFNTGG